MEQLKIYLLNAVALAISVTEVEPLLQLVSLSLAIIYTLISIFKKLK
jgi:hypothetical protein